MWNLQQQKPCMLALQNNKNDLQDFDSLSDLSAGACSKIFEEGAKMCFVSAPWAQLFKESGVRKILQNYTQIYEI